MTVYNNNAGKTQGGGLNPDGSFKYLIEYIDEDGNPVVENTDPAKLKIQPNTLDIGNTTSIKDDFSLVGVSDKLNERNYGIPYVSQSNEDGTTDGVFYRKIGDFQWSDPFGGGFVATDEVMSVLNTETGLYEIQQPFIIFGVIASDKLRYWITEYDGNRTLNTETDGIQNIVTVENIAGDKSIEVYNETNTYLIDNPEGKDIEIKTTYILPQSRNGLSIWISKKPFSMKRMSNNGGVTNIVYIESFIALVEAKRIITEDEITNIVIDIDFYSMKRATSDTGLEKYNGEESWVDGGIDNGAVPYLNTANSKLTKALISARSISIFSNTTPDSIVSLNIELYEVNFTSTTKIADLVFPIDSLTYNIGNNSSTNIDTFFDGEIELDIDIESNKKYGLKFVRVDSTGDVSAYRDMQINLRTEQKPVIIPVTI